MLSWEDKNKDLAYNILQINDICKKETALYALLEIKIYRI